MYSKQPYLEELEAAGTFYILVVEMTDHTALFEWVEALRRTGETGLPERRDHKGYTHRYEWAAQVPLNAQSKSDHVNFLEYSMSSEDGRITDHNGWVGNIAVVEANVAEMVKCGRARWKIENEGFNTLVNHVLEASNTHYRWKDKGFQGESASINL
ncbi:MAG: hypothetical protein V1816_12325 [Pseudomonadota bacterium]